MLNEELQFKGRNPGAVQYGNFINYYNFHPPSERINMLPINVLAIREPYEILDIGCNAGDLTIALKKYLDESLNISTKIFAIDIDPTLIKRATEINIDKSVTFKCLDIMDNLQKNEISSYLEARLIQQFSITFCFSITMWIHLNHGDGGLKTFLKYITSISEILVIEPQPWKCYKTAVRRMKQQHFSFHYFDESKIQHDVERKIEQFILEECNLIKIFESERTKWNRKIMVFKQQS